MMYTEDVLKEAFVESVGGRRNLKYPDRPIELTQMGRLLAVDSLRVREEKRNPRKQNRLSPYVIPLTQACIKEVRKLRLALKISKKQRIAVNLEPNSDLQLAIFYLYPCIYYYVEAIENCELIVHGEEIFKALSPRESYFDKADQDLEVMWGHIGDGEIPDGTTFPEPVMLARRRQLEMRGAAA